MREQPRQDTRPHDQLPLSFQGMDDLSTERSFKSQATWVIGVFDLFLDTLSMGVYATKDWQTPGRLVQG